MAEQLLDVFLYQFAKKFPSWMHIDMAPKVTAVYDEFLAKGDRLVRQFAFWLRRLKSYRINTEELNTR